MPVLDPHCWMHYCDNLHVVDGSCVVSASGDNPSLTAILDTIRIAIRLLAEQRRRRVFLRISRTKEVFRGYQGSGASQTVWNFSETVELHRPDAR
jgi:superfamily I DNA and RNA helicase